MRKSYPLTKLVEDWDAVITNAALESGSLRNKRMRRTMALIVHRLRIAFIGFYSPIKLKAWDQKAFTLANLPEWKYNLPILEFDRSFFQNFITRAIVMDVWNAIEIYFRGRSQDPIAVLIRNSLGTIPPATNALRLLRNCFHNAGIHMPAWKGDKNVSYKIRGWKFDFKYGNHVKNFHPAAILGLVDEAICELADLTK